MSRAQTPSTDATAQLYARSQDAVVSLKVELQKARTEVARLTHDALILRDQNRRLLDDQEQLSLARRDAEGKLRFRMRQVLELEQERTSFAMKEGEMSSQIGDLEEKWTSMCKELNDTKTEMKVLAARNQILEETVADTAHQNSVPFDAYRRLETESESLKKTIKDLQNINISQAKKLDAEVRHNNKFHRDQDPHHSTNHQPLYSDGDYKPPTQHTPLAPSSDEIKPASGHGGPHAEHKPHTAATHIHAHTSHAGSSSAEKKEESVPAPPAPTPAPVSTGASALPSAPPSAGASRSATPRDAKPKPPAPPAVKTTVKPVARAGTKPKASTTKAAPGKAGTKKSKGKVPSLKINVEKEELSSPPHSPTSMTDSSSFAEATQKPAITKPKIAKKKIVPKRK